MGEISLHGFAWPMPLREKHFVRRIITMETAPLLDLALQGAKLPWRETVRVFTLKHLEDQLRLHSRRILQDALNLRPYLRERV
jgi:hypothetical protein